MGSYVIEQVLLDDNMHWSIIKDDENEVYHVCYRWDDDLLKEYKYFNDVHDAHCCLYERIGQYIIDRCDIGDNVFNVNYESRF